MLKCEGYKMFKGKMRVVPKNPKYPPFVEDGTWLYKPNYDCWYVNGSSYMASIVDESSIEEG